MTHPQTPTLFSWLAVIVLAVIWGASFMSVSVALTGFQPLTLAAARIVLAAMILIAVARLRGIRLPSIRHDRQLWLFAAGMGVLSNALPFTMLAWALQHVTSGFAGVSMAMVPLFTLALAHALVPGERMTPTKVAGFALGLAGVVTLIGTDGITLGNSAVEWTARLVCVGSTLSYALGSIVTRRCPPIDGVAFSTAALIVASVIMVPLALLIEGVPPLPNTTALVAMAYLGIMPTAIATLLLVWVIRTAGPTFLTQTNYQVPVWSVIFGTLILSEPLPPQFIAALALILCGLAISRARFRRAGLR